MCHQFEELPVLLFLTVQSDYETKVFFFKIIIKYDFIFSVQFSFLTLVNRIRLSMLKKKERKTDTKLLQMSSFKK